MLVETQYDVIAWWSGGITSAVACRLAIDTYQSVRVIMMDTNNEDEDTYRFKEDCESWYGCGIEVIASDKFRNPVDVWRHYKALNNAHGAVCSSELKRDVRKRWQRNNNYSGQVFGFEFTPKEQKRARSMSMNYPDALPLFPLIDERMTKEDCLWIVRQVGIEHPRAYGMGLHNNNCLKTGCVQGGIGYWQKIREDMPEKFEQMAAWEHELTNLKGKPVTMLKDQSKRASRIVSETEDKWRQFVFLLPHPDYPENKSLSDMQGRPPEPLSDCNGFCGLDDLLMPSERKQDTYEQLAIPGLDA